MKALTLLLAGWILCCTLLACGRKEVASSNVSKGTNVTVPFDVQGSPSPAASPDNGEDRFAFDRNQNEVQINPITKVVPKELKENNKPLKFEIYVSYPQF